ncbi:type I secretion system permease/ATPase [Comamonas endophytica]|uniref:Type I secretion system permease/ATPase n=1 Tax=Comamonas endophytica TaxID=2949090 RepID=A0ABY6GC84_9BURK|nr:MULTISPECIES: type I secretion system permease/ATPase [unclassified Acidovorax]MCD2513922.1 type I secretion system permease/ATPase [Acidovorax sp. D4N7]UYG52084.1 type I secretion system permease/ATPase [Acidovorax sp. 5MLIR]
MKAPTSPNELASALAALKPCFLRAGGFSVLASVLVLAPSVYMLEVYDRVVNSRNPFTLLMLTLAVLGTYALMETLEWARSEIMRAAGSQLDARMRGRIFDAMFAARLKQAGGASTQPLSDLRLVCDFLFSPALLALMEAPIALLMMVLLFLISPVLGWSAVVFALLQVTVAWCNERRTKPPLMEANRSSFAAQQYADASLRNAEVLEAMGMLRHLQGRWLQRQQRFLALQARASESAGGFQALGRLLQNVLGSLLLGLGCWLLLHDQLRGGGGMMMIGSILGGRMLAPLVQAVAQWQGVVNVRDAWERLAQLLQAVPERAPGMALPVPRGRLQVEQLVAGAPGAAAPILRGIAFALNPGEVLAVIGPSASGKTTLARQLVGLWPAQSGKVRLDDADLHRWNKQELGPHLGYLPQGVELFEGTVAQNIARFGPVQPAQVEAAARAVGLHEFILGLPGGYDSPVGDGGARLSGGQRQRLGLARALYGEPALVVLDEPNSSLDEEGNAALAQAIAVASARGTTFVVITHLSSVLDVAGKLLVLRDGRQQAFGPRAEVLAALAASVRPASVPCAGPSPVLQPLPA